MKAIAYNVVMNNRNTIVDQFPTKKAANAFISDCKREAKEEGAECADLEIEPVR
jgi:hypothetical protein